MILKFKTGVVWELVLELTAFVFACIMWHRNMTVDTPLFVFFVAITLMTGYLLGQNLIYYVTVYLWARNYTPGATMFDVDMSAKTVTMVTFNRRWKRADIDHIRMLSEQVYPEFNVSTHTLSLPIDVRVDTYRSSL